MFRFKNFITITVVFFTLFTSVAYAQVVIDMTDRGWYARNGEHIADNQNTITGPGYRGDTNSWFLFNLSGVQASVCSATLRLEMENWNAGSTTGESSIWDVSTDPAILVQSHLANNPEGMAITIDLETGANYGNATVFQSDIGSVIEFTLSDQAVADINAAAGGLFAVGTHLTAVDQSTWLRWSGSEEPTLVHQLVLDTGSECGLPSTPVPTLSNFSLTLFGLILAIFAAFGIRHHRGRPKT